ncbi:MULTISPECIES: hypothetical protein [unclassified Frankia]|uniref:hypothetical protein n=1 Tax=unclassified Frankia TaxID=2632575 RepID=UPI001EF4453A|nr:MULTISPECIES: hypothetical protein [unclassified Frankia]
MLRATDPFEVDQEIPALLLGAALLRAVRRSVAAQATPAQRGARAGQPVLARELSTKATVLAITRHLGAATPGLPDEVVASRLAAVHSALGRRRNTPGRNRTRERRAKSVSEFPHAGPGLTTRTVVYETRICGPIIDTLTAAAPRLTLPDVTERDHTPQPAMAA